MHPVGFEVNSPIFYSRSLRLKSIGGGETSIELQSIDALRILAAIKQSENLLPLQFAMFESKQSCKYKKAELLSISFYYQLHRTVKRTLEIW